jgi:hypothetical protein
MSIYCTYLTVYNGNLMPKFYIGSTSLNKINRGYHGTVKSKRYKSIWKTELQEHPEFFITHVLTRHDTRTDALERESRFHEKLKVHRNPMYINMATANGKFYNQSLTDEHKHALLLAALRPKSKEHKRKIGLGNKGKIRSPELRKRIGDAQRGLSRPEFSEEHRKNISKALMGKSLSQEHRAKISQIQMGKKLSEEHKKKIGSAQKNRVFSEEHKRKISESKRLSWKRKKGIN